MVVILPYKLYVTFYNVGTAATYGGEIEAIDLKHAYELAKMRGLNERVQHVRTHTKPDTYLPDYIKKREWNKAVHEATYLSYVGLASGVLTPKETVGDQGLVHDICHIMQWKKPKILKRTDVPVEARKELMEASERVFNDACSRLHAQALDYMNRVPGWPYNLYLQHREVGS